MFLIKTEFENFSFEFLSNLISSNNYLFHITNESNLIKILKIKSILPFTVDGTRSCKLDIKEKGTASFTENPLQIYEEDHSGCFDEKNIVLVLERNILVNQGVFPAIYVPEQLLLTNYLDDYRYAVEEASFETEWRSLSEVYIKDALKYICYIPEREWDDTTNLLKFI